MKNLYKIGDELYIVDNTEEINKDTKTCWCIDISCNELVLHQGVFPSYHYKHYKKIIMTTDKSINVLCSCGKDCGAKASDVQAIHDEFLEWFCKNPSCEFVETKLFEFEVDMGLGESCIEYGNYYKIIIPKEELKQCCDSGVVDDFCINTLKCKYATEEPKQETLEEAAEKLALEYQLGNTGKIDIEDAKEMLIEFAKWQQQRSYSEEEVYDILIHHTVELFKREPITLEDFWNKFKKK